MLRWSDRKLWRQARHLDEVGALTADWLSGSLGSSPSYGRSGPDPETAELMPLLAGLNQLGYVTSQSQPGHVGAGHDGAHWEQRAAIMGFCYEDLAKAIEHRALGMGMYTTIYGADGVSWDEGMTEHVVTTRAGQPYTEFGRWAGAAQMDLDYGQLHPRAVKALRSACQVTVVDPQWGRKAQIWRALGPLAGIVEFKHWA